MDPLFSLRLPRVPSGFLWHLPALAGLLILAPVLAAAAEGRAPSSAQQTAQLLERLKTRVQAIDEYDCLMEGEHHGNGDSRQGIYRIWFRQPELMRVKVIKGGHKGSEVMLTATGKVRARAGGLFKVFPQSMDRADRRLKDPRGRLPWDAAWEPIHRRLSHSVATAETLELTPMGPDTYKVCLTRGENGHRMRENWTFRLTGCPVERIEVDEDGKPVERIQFRDYHENPGLAANFFSF